MPTNIGLGYQTIDNGDRGNVFGDVINSNTQNLRDHKHDGSDSEKILSANLDKQATTIDKANWIASGALYQQSVNLPAGVDLDLAHPVFKLASGSSIGSTTYPTVEKISSSIMRVIVNDNTLDLTVLFL